MSNIELFKFEEREVRIVVIDNEPWFVGADICNVLEIENKSNVYDRLRPYEKKTLHNMEGLDTSNPEVVIISESGMYRVVMTSRKPNAERFQDWVCEEVLPSIRKNGFYSTDNLTPLERLQIVVNAGVEHERRLKEQEAIVKRLDKEVELLKTVAIEAAAELTNIPRSTEEPLTISERDLIRQLVNSYCRSKGLKQQDVWNMLYSKLAYATHIDVKARAKNSKKSALEEVERAGLIPELYKIASKHLT